MPDLALYGLGGLVFYQAYVTVRVVRNKSFAPERKRRHYLLIWMVPFIGAAMALADLDKDK